MPASICLRRRVLALLFALVGLSLSITALAQVVPTPRYAEGVVLVGYRAGTSKAARANAIMAAAATRASPLSNLEKNSEKLHLAPGASVLQAIKVLMRNPNVRYAEPDYILTEADTGDDPYYNGGNLWGMYGDTTTPANVYGSQAGEAWAAGYTGSSQVYIGIIDSGIQISHPDLASNIWTNPIEIAGNNVDDDGNGKVDDIHGWDFYYNDASVYDGVEDSHGTHVAGTIGGVGGNGIGVVGMNWEVKLIPAKFIGPNGSGYVSNAIAAIDYINDLKTRHSLNIVATSNSWAGGGYSWALRDAINRGGDRGILFIAAAGNESTNTDTTPNYPSNYQCTTATRLWDCVISVAAINSTGALSWFSNYGGATVDLGAPGEDINSTLPPDTYGSLSGTSMATPHVSGAAALCASMDSTQTTSDLRFALLTSATRTTSLAGNVVTGGRLDVGAMLTACIRPTAPVIGGSSSLSATPTGATSIRLAWTDGATGESYFEIDRAPTGCQSFTHIASVGAGITVYDATGLAPETGYCFRVRAGNRLPSVSAWSDNASAVTPPVPPPYQCSPTAFQWQDISTAPALPLDDDSSATVTMPFSWRFYGTPTTQLLVSSNGFVGLDGGAATEYLNVPIPNSTEPNGYIAPFWDDLFPGVGGAVRAATAGTWPSRQFVVSWENVPHVNVWGSTLSFQVILEEATGDAVINYLDVIAGDTAYDQGASATVGIENPTGDGGTLLSYNSSSLSDATAYRCSTQALTVTLTPSVASPGTIGNTVTFSAAASGGSGQYQYRYYLGVPGGQQTLVRDYSTTASWSWNTSGLTPGTYAVVVHARNVGSTKSYETYRALSYGLATPASSVTLAPSVASPAMIGSTVTFSAAASGGSGQYQYRYYLGVPGGAQTLVRDYSTVASWNWNTSGLAAGTYTVVVHARSVGSTKSYETYKALSYGLRVP